MKVQSTAVLPVFEALPGNSGGVGKSFDKDHVQTSKWTLHKLKHVKKLKQLTNVGYFVQMSC